MDLLQVSEIWGVFDSAIKTLFKDAGQIPENGNYLIGYHLSCVSSLKGFSQTHCKYILTGDYEHYLKLIALHKSPGSVVEINNLCVDGSRYFLVPRILIPENTTCEKKLIEHVRICSIRVLYPNLSNS